MTCQRCKKPYTNCTCDLQTQDMFPAVDAQTIAVVKLTKPGYLKWPVANRLQAIKTSLKT